MCVCVCVCVCDYFKSYMKYFDYYPLYYFFPIIVAFYHFIVDWLYLDCLNDQRRLSLKHCNKKQQRH